MFRASGLTLVVALALTGWTGSEARADSLDPQSITSSATACQPTGCSGQVCADRSVITTCEWREEYACYDSATCERQPNGQCGWTQTAELAFCLQGGNPGAPDEGGALYPQVQGCLDSGGSVTKGLCCLSTQPFPNTCLIGACGCSPDYSHEVPVCSCPQGSCFNGYRCVGHNPPPPPVDPMEQACLASGGTVDTGSCCQSVGDFPNTCLIGACGCSPDYSHDVKVCQCPEGSCFDGQGCTNPLPPPPPPANPKAKACLLSGGAIQKSLCCQSVDDFPNTCLIGACGCSPDYSHEVDSCSCPAGQCFNGKSCVAHIWM